MGPPGQASLNVFSKYAFVLLSSKTQLWKTNTQAKPSFLNLSQDNDQICGIISTHEFLEGMGGESSSSLCH